MAASAVHYPFAAVGNAGDVFEVANGVFRVRMPLPFTLDHINLRLLRDGRGWTVADTGIATRRCRSTGGASSRKRPGAARSNGSSSPTSTPTTSTTRAGSPSEYGADLRARLGVAVEAALAAPGEIAALTGVERRQKPVRLIHERARPPPAKRARRRS